MVKKRRSQSKRKAANGDNLYSLRLVNAVYTMTMSSYLNLTWLHYTLADTKLYPSRPHMLKWKFENERTILLFPRGKLQFIGHICQSEANAMHHQVLSILRKECDIPDLSITPPKVNTMTLTYKFPFKFNLRSLPCNGQFSFEPELFLAPRLWLSDSTYTIPCSFSGLKTLGENNSF